MRTWLAALVALAACDEPVAGLDRHDCEAVYAHLVVLERADRDVTEATLPSHDHFVRACPRALSVREARCYQRATSVFDADVCLARRDLAARVRAGRRDERPGGMFGRRATHDALSAVLELRDAACACADSRCTDDVQRRFDRWLADAASLDTAADRAAADAIGRAAGEMMECISKVTYRDPWATP